MYRNKYLKYKTKYLVLKNALSGGATNIKLTLTTISSRKIDIDVLDNITIRQLKEKANTYFETSDINSITLMFNSRSLNNDNDTLQASGIINNSVIHIMPKITFLAELPANQINVLFLCANKSSITSNKYLDIIRSIPNIDNLIINKLVFVNSIGIRDNRDIIANIQNNIQVNINPKIISFDIFSGNIQSYITQTSGTDIFDIIINIDCPAICFTTEDINTFFELIKKFLRPLGKVMVLSDILAKQKYPDIVPELTNNCLKLESSPIVFTRSISPEIELYTKK